MIPNGREGALTCFSSRNGVLGRGFVGIQRCQMAIYHLTVKTGSRIGGQSALAKSDYIEREGRYAKDAEEVEYKESGNMPEWAEDDPRQYWAASSDPRRAATSGDSIPRPRRRGRDATACIRMTWS